jgi:hypothetical protein
MSDGLASGFEGPGEAPRDATGVLEPWSPLEEPFTEATLSGWAESGDDIGLTDSVPGHPGCLIKI